MRPRSVELEGEGTSVVPVEAGQGDSVSRHAASPGREPRRRPPGSTDVARLAGVSQKTVSRVLNGERYVSADVRARVLEAARTLGYRRNEAARALNTGRFHRLGAVALGSPLFGPASQLIAIERAVRESGYPLSLITTEEGRPGAIARAVDALLRQGVDGIVLAEPIDEGERLDLDVGVPVLSFGSARDAVPPSVIVAGVTTDPARQATEFLLSLGHRTVWHVAGPVSWWSARDRRDGWREALEAAGVPVPEPVEGDWSPASGLRAARRLLKEDDVTAVFVGNDDMAIGFMRGLREAGRRIPEDVSVVGFDDIPAAAYLTPSLTTVRQNFMATVEHGLARLLAVLEGGSEPVAARRDDEIELIVRESATSPGGTGRTRGTGGR